MIDKFMYEHHFLSNFHLGDVEFEGAVYPSLEHAYVAAKTLDPTMREKVRAVKLPGKVKKLGRKLDLRPDWELVKVDVMRDLIAKKFRTGTEIAVKLMDTVPHELVEGNWWGDTFWGVCKGVGENWLGKLLMERRDFLIREVGSIGRSSDRLG